MQMCIWAAIGLDTNLLASRLGWFPSIKAFTPLLTEIGFEYVRISHSIEMTTQYHLGIIKNKRPSSSRCLLCCPSGFAADDGEVHLYLQHSLNSWMRVLLWTAIR